MHGYRLIVGIATSFCFKTLNKIIKFVVVCLQTALMLPEVSRHRHHIPNEYTDRKRLSTGSNYGTKHYRENI